MRRALAVLLITAMAMPMGLTAYVLVQFQLERDRIIKEVCVQRDRPLERNCCKGMCHLRKQLKAQEGEEHGPRSLPRIELREEPAVPVADRTVPLALRASERSFGPRPDPVFTPGFTRVAEPVPWC